MSTKAKFIEPMLLLRTDLLSEGVHWRYELKLDGYRAIAFKSAGKLHLRSRIDKDFAVRYPAVVKGLAGLPDETVIDGEVVAFDKEGRPSFNALQNYASSPAAVPSSGGVFGCETSVRTCQASPGITDSVPLRPQMIS